MTDRRQPNTFNIIGWGQSLSSNLKRIFLYGAIGVIVKWLRNNTAKTLRVATEGLIAVISYSIQRLATLISEHSEVTTINLSEILRRCYLSTE